MAIGDIAMARRVCALWALVIAVYINFIMESISRDGPDMPIYDIAIHHKMQKLRLILDLMFMILGWFSIQQVQNVGRNHHRGPNQGIKNC